MKKNTMMRAASALLVAVLLTTCTISGTFAKYTTQDSGSDTARVAKWGVVLQVIGNLYGETYLDAIVADNADTDGEATTNLSVQANDHATIDDDVVAPGTLNENGLSISLNGTPEVDGQVVTTIEYENIYLTKGSYGVMAAVASDVVTKENFATHGTLYTFDSTTQKYSVAATYTDTTTTYYTLEDNVTLNEDYYPVEYMMTGALAKYNTGYDAALSTDTLAKVIEAFTSELGTKGIPSVDAGKTTCTWTKAFTANTNLKTALKIGGQNIFWKWDFENSTSCSSDNSCDFCKADTILGDLAAGSDATAVVKLVDNSTDPYYAAPTPATGTAANDYNLETGLSINITVTQVD